MRLQRAVAGSAANMHIPQAVRSHWLVAARVLLAMLAALGVAILIASCWLNYIQQQTVLTSDDVQALQSTGLSVRAYAIFTVTLQVIFSAAWWIVGALVFWRKFDEPMALLVALSAVFAATDLSSMGPLVSASPSWALLAKLIGQIGGICFVLCFFLFPDGRFVPRWTRWVLILWIALQLPDLVSQSHVALQIARLREGLVMWVTLGTVAFAQIYRYRRISNQVQRQQTKWVVFGIATGLGGIFALGLLGMAFSSLYRFASLGNFAIQLGFTFFSLLIPLSLGIAMLRYRLWDIDPIINRTLVYGTLTASVVCIYVLVVGGLGVLLQARSNLIISLLATGLIAVLFQPLRDRLQRAVNRLMYGERDEPYAVISRLGQRLEAALAPDSVLPTIVETVKETLKLPYVAIALEGDERPTTNDEAASPDASFEIVAASGTPTSGEALHLPLVYQNETVGQLILEPRTPGETFSSADHRLLNDLARQAGVATHAVRLHAQAIQLAEDLQRSREHLVTAREEERRRLRRDLHDGLGPRLASQTMKLEATRDLLAVDLARADALLADLIAQSQSVITDIRRLVYALRPPALDELGLVSTIREQAAQYVHTGLQITIDAPEKLPPLPAAVEVAAYRIAQEALANVVRHAHAQHCTIRLTLDDAALSLEIVDDGTGLPAERRAGVGLNSMRERAEELGGSCMVETVSTGGTRVLAQLPLAF